MKAELLLSPLDSVFKRSQQYKLYYVGDKLVKATYLTFLRWLMETYTTIDDQYI